MGWTLSLSPFILLYFWLAVGFELCPNGNLLQQAVSHVLSLVYTLFPWMLALLSLAQEDLLVFLVFGSPMFFLFLLKVIGLAVSTLPYYFLISYYFVINLCSVFFLNFKISFCSTLPSNFWYSVNLLIKVALNFVLLLCNWLTWVLFCLVIPLTFKSTFYFALDLYHSLYNVVNVIILVCVHFLVVLGLVSISSILGFTKIILLSLFKIITIMSYMGNY